MNVTEIKSFFLHLKLLFNHITTLLKVEKTCVTSLKTLEIATKVASKQNWSIPETIQQQSQQQISHTKETLKLVCPLKFYDNILTELQKDEKNFKGGLD